MFSFASPAAFALAPLLGIIVAFYMLKVRREDRRVPSTMLWRALMQDPPANAPWQPPRRDLLLLLQLLFLGLLLVSLARPYRMTDEIVGENLIVLVDRSASMAATDVEPTRLEAAKERVLDLLATAGGARVTLIAFDDDLEVLAAAESDRARLERALDELQPVPVRGRLDDAIAFASALAEGQPSTQIVLLSDGNVARAGDAAASAPVRYIPVGESGDNQAVTALSISDGPAGGPPELFVQIGNFAPSSVRRRVETRVDGRLYDARDVAVSPGGRDAFTLSLPDDVYLVETTLRSADVLPLDDTAWAVRAQSAQARVTLVSDGNRYLETAIGLLPAVESVTQVDSAGMDEPYGLTDVAVLDGLIPARLPPGNLLIIGPMQSVGTARLVGQLRDPVPRVVQPEHRLVAHAELDRVAILSAAALELGPEWTPVVVADVAGRQWPLVAEGVVAGRAAVLLAFDLRQSDLPLRPAFPLVMASAFEMLAPSTVVGLAPTVGPGEPVTLRLAPQVEAVGVIDPGGRRHRLPIENGLARFAGTGELGAYRVEVRAGRGFEQLAFAVNLASVEESNVRPVHSVAFRQSGADSSGASLAQGRRELWWPLGLICLGLLLAEWGYDHRAALRRLADRLEVVS